MYAQRQERLDRLLLVIWGSDREHRVHAFEDEVAFVTFLSEFETDTLADGWSLVDFIQERRHRHDRRAVPRAADRRRPSSDAPATVIGFPRKQLSDE